MNIVCLAIAFTWHPVDQTERVIMFVAINVCRHCLRLILHHKSWHLGVVVPVILTPVSNSNRMQVVVIIAVY